MTGLAQDALNRSIRDAARDLAERHLAPAPTAAALSDLVREAVELAENLAREITAREIVGLDAIACAKGCAWCCRLPVGVTAPQALAIAEHIRAGHAAITAPTARRKLRARLEDAARFRPCAFLKEDLCMIYDVRPFGCRGANSVDAGLCRDLVERGDGDATPDRDWVHAVPYRAMAALQDGLLAGAIKAGLADDRLELTRAIAIALDDAGAAEKWLAGADVFAAARVKRSGRAAGEPASTRNTDG